MRKKAINGPYDEFTRSHRRKVKIAFFTFRGVKRPPVCVQRTGRWMDFLRLPLILVGITLAGCNTSTTNSSQTETGAASTTTSRVPDPVRGAVLFAANCAVCHGQEGMGSKQGPPLINPIYKPSHHNDFSFYRAVNNGSRQHHWQFGDMPPVPGVSIKDTSHIIAYIRQQQRLAGIE